MKILNEDEIAGDQLYARELLTAQKWYNDQLQRINNQLASKKNIAMVNYQKRIAAQQAQAKATAAQPQAQKPAQSNNQTGNVTTAGQPVNAKGSPSSPTVESYSDIIRVKKLEEEFVDKYAHIPMEKRNWYQKPDAQPGYEEWKEEQDKLSKKSRKKKMTPKILNKKWNLEGEIQDLRNELRFMKEKYESPNFEGAEGEMEEFFAQIGPEASEILNSGAYKNDEEKAYALSAVGVQNPEQIIQDYYYYYPEFNSNLDGERDNSEKEIQDIQEKIEKLEAELANLEAMYESVNESQFITTNADGYEIQELKDYLDAENISYMEDEEGETIDFDETELDREWQDRLPEMGLEENIPEDEPETDDILTIEDDEFSDEEDITDKDEKIDEEKVFYVKVEDEGEAFVGKIYKLFDEGDWRSKIVDGESETFEQLNYDPEWDEFDIIAFLRENYADAELVSEDEFNDHVEEPEAEPEEMEESWAAAARVAAPIVKKGLEAAAVTAGVNIADKYTKKSVEEDEEEGPKEDVEEKNESAKFHTIPTLDDYLNEVS